MSLLNPFNGSTIKVSHMSKTPKVVLQKYYVVVEDLPPDQKDLFYDWLTEKTTPVVIEEEIARQKWVMCGYAEDYDYWYDVVFNPATIIV